MEEKEVSKKDWLTSLILCWFLGFLGIHRLYVGKITTGFLMLLGTIVAAAVLVIDVYLGATAFVIVGAFVVNDFLNILLKCFKDVQGREVSSDTVIK